MPFAEGKGLIALKLLKSNPVSLLLAPPTLLYHALSREELCKLRVRDYKHERRGVTHLKVSGKAQTRPRWSPENRIKIIASHAKHATLDC